MVGRVIGTRLRGSMVRFVNRVPASLAAALAVVLCVGACSGSGHSSVATAVVTQTRGLPPGVSEAPSALAAGNPKSFATWAQGHEIYVTTWGSGSCPRLPTSVKPSGAHDVQIKTAELSLHSGDNACTSDLTATTSTVTLPSGMDDTGSLTVNIDGTPTRLPSRTR